MPGLHHHFRAGFFRSDGCSFATLNIYKKRLIARSAPPIWLAAAAVAHPLFDQKDKALCHPGSVAGMGGKHEL